MTELSVGDRYADIKASLIAKRDALKERVRSRLRLMRGDGAAKEPQTAFEEVEPGTDTEFHLTQMEAKLLERVLEALERLEEGTFGECCDCGDDVSEQRLQALPFAVRCTDCQKKKEAEDPSVPAGASYRNAH